MADFGDVASGALSGGEAGFSIGGPWGAAIGGVAGGLLGAFTPSAPKLQPISNPYQGQIDASINRLMESRVGAQMAQNQAAGYRRDARAAFDTYQGNSAVSGNAAVMSALYNKTQSTAADAITNANTHGAMIDQQAHSQGLNAAMGEQRNNFSQQQYNNYVQQMNNRPGPLQQILMNSLSQAAGSGLGKIMGGLGGGNDASPPGSTITPGGPRGAQQVESIAQAPIPGSPVTPSYPSGVQPIVGQRVPSPQLGMFDSGLSFGAQPSSQGGDQANPQNPYGMFGGNFQSPAMPW